jgi:hypothetical protein
MHAISSAPSPADVKEPACTFGFVHEYYSAGEHASGHAVWKPTNICANVQRSRANPVGRSRTALSLLNTIRHGEKIELTSLQITQLSWGNTIDEGRAELDELKGTSPQGR